ncbi:MAG: rRNA maturation RNase YbeY [Prolixibacteraceae bacterium]
MSINFYYEDVTVLRLAKRNLRTWINLAVREESKRTGEINFIFCSDEYLLQVNQQYLEHDYYTDIITFDYVEGDIVSGDIFISTDRIKENAVIFKVSFADELNRIMIHGILHLLGYQDKEAEEKRLMTEKEDHYLSKLTEDERF